MLGVDHGPAVGEPELRPCVAVRLHELEPFTTGHRAIGQPERREVDDMAGKLVVEAEPASGVADLDLSAAVLDPPRLGRRDTGSRVSPRRRKPGAGDSSTARA